MATIKTIIREIPQRQKKRKKLYRLYGCKADLLEVNEYIIKYKIPTDAGKSGAPLLIYSEHGKYKIIGIHTGGYNKKKINFALRINEPIIIKITELIKQLDKDSRV
jgi:V8-like Glu-specific endopeptidase